MTWKESLATELRVARGKDSQAEVAARSGVSDRTIGLIEQQKIKKKPRPDTIVRLALATGNDPDQWLAKVGLKVPPGVIDQVRREVRAVARLDKLKEPEEIEREVIEAIEGAMRAKLSEVGDKLAQVEPAGILREQLKKYVHEHVENAFSVVEPAHKLRKELRDYVDLRIHNLEQILKDLMLRVDHLQNGIARKSHGTAVRDRKDRSRK
jgi:transcriptional regulator with XRE-family HTH domain